MGVKREDEGVVARESDTGVGEMMEAMRMLGEIVGTVRSEL